MFPKNEVIKLAALARIALTKQEVQLLQKEFADIIAYVGEVSTVAETGGDFDVRLARNVFRDDVAVSADAEVVERLIASAPQANGRRISVKKILP